MLRTNLEEGPVLGKTITTDARVGGLLTAVLAVASTMGTVSNTLQGVVNCMQELHICGISSRLHIIRLTPTAAPQMGFSGNSKHCYAHFPLRVQSWPTC
jgi:hypothetical protein